MTKEQAQLIVEATGMNELLADEEKVLMLQKYNPVLLRAYRALLAFAEGVEEP